MKRLLANRFVWMTAIGAVVLSLPPATNAAEKSLAPAALQSESLFGPWKHGDIGAIDLRGRAMVEQDTYTVRGTLDTWGTNDGFHYVWLPLRGDGRIVARVLAVSNTLNHAKGGVMIRESLEPGSKHVEAAVTATDGTQFLVRGDTGGKTVSTHTSTEKGKFPWWIQLVREGNQIRGYESSDGSQWTLIGSTNLSMSSEVFIGLAGSSHQKTILGTAVFDHVAVKTSGP